MLKMVKKDYISKRKKILIRFFAIFIALLTSSFFIKLLGHNPFNVYISIFKGAFGSKYRIIETLKVAIPLILTSIGIMIAFKMKFWNIGGEGQILMGAFFASYFALYHSYLPKPILLLVMLIAGFIGGSLWALIPALLKVKFNTNETIITLMLNYIAIKWITFLKYGPWKDPNAFGFPSIKTFESSAILPKLFGLHIGWVLTIIVVITITILMKYSKWGYNLSIIGESKDTARYAGIDINKTIIFSILASGGICGIVGFIQASAINQSLTPMLSAGYGFTAIITTWLSSLLPSLIIPVSLLFAGLIKGGSFIQTAFGIPASAADILQSTILFFVIGSEFFIKYDLKLFIHKKEVTE